MARLSHVMRAAAAALLAVGVISGFGGPVPAQAEQSSCTLTAYSFDSASAADRAVTALRGDGAAASDISAIPLAGQKKAVEFDRGSQLIFVVEGKKDLGEVDASLTGYGGLRTAGEFSRKVAESRAVLGPWKFGSPTTARLAVQGAGCDTALTLVASGSSTTRMPVLLGGLLGLVGTTIAVMVARRRRVGFRAKATAALIAAGIGLVAGLGEAVVLYETGAIAPQNPIGWVVPGIFAVGAIVATFLPHRRRRARPKAPTQKALPHNAVLGRYQLKALLGTGSTGSTYLAVDPVTKSDVALKVLAPELTSDMHFVHRFFDEAQVMRRLSDRHCVRLIDFLSQPGAITIVSEYVRGTTLRELLRQRHRLTGEQALAVLTGAVRGLAHLHGLGLVHRDVKPDNIMLDLAGTSRLIDYGLVRSVDVVSEDIEGSPSYMSPEQILNRPLTNRSDIYSCGAVLAELLTGRRIFAGDSVAATVNNQLTMPVPNFTETDGVHPELAAVAQRALAKDPAMRFGDAEEFLTALERAAVAAFGPEWDSRVLLGGAISALVGAGISGAATALAAGGGTAAIAGGAPLGATGLSAHIGANAVTAAVADGSAAAAVNSATPQLGAAGVGPLPPPSVGPVPEPSTVPAVDSATGGPTTGGPAPGPAPEPAPAPQPAPEPAPEPVPTPEPAPELPPMHDTHKGILVGTGGVFSAAVVAVIAAVLTTVGVGVTAVVAQPVAQQATELASILAPSQARTITADLWKRLQRAVDDTPHLAALGVETSGYVSSAALGNLHEINDQYQDEPGYECCGAYQFATMPLPDLDITGIYLERFDSYPVEFYALGNVAKKHEYGPKSDYDVSLRLKKERERAQWQLTSAWVLDADHQAPNLTTDGAGFVQPSPKPKYDITPKELAQRYPKYLQESVDNKAAGNDPLFVNDPVTQEQIDKTIAAVRAVTGGGNTATVQYKAVDHDNQSNPDPVTLPDGSIGYSFVYYFELDYNGFESYPRGTCRPVNFADVYLPENHDPQQQIDPGKRYWNFHAEGRMRVNAVIPNTNTGKHGVEITIGELSAASFQNASECDDDD